MNASEKWERRRRLLKTEYEKSYAYAASDLMDNIVYEDVEERIEYVPIDSPSKNLTQSAKQSTISNPTPEWDSLVEKANKNQLTLQSIQERLNSIEEASQQILSTIQHIHTTPATPLNSPKPPTIEIDSYSLTQSIIVPIQKEIKRLETDIRSLKKTPAFYSSPDDLFFDKSIFKEETKKFDKELANITLADIDKMDGNSFSDYIAALFKQKGYETRTLKRSHDYGVDVIASNDIVRIGIQCKICNSDHLKPSAVQEVIAGLRYYTLDKGILISNSYFSQTIKELARANNITLWNREALARQIRKLQGENRQ